MEVAAATAPAVTVAAAMVMAAVALVALAKEVRVVGTLAVAVAGETGRR